MFLGAVGGVFWEGGMAEGEKGGVLNIVLTVTRYPK